jgi:F0F1-type ATP synthase membrane subunit c/vacuolar-type H+-ATPase subunit K
VSSVFAYSIIIFSAAGGIAAIATATATSMARQPEVRGNLQTIFFLGAAFCESLGLFGFLLALLNP